MSLRIAGTGSALPGVRLTNDDLAKRLDTSDEWIRTHTGISERRICGPGESAYTLGVSAAKAALEDAGVSGAEITMVICHSVAPDEIIPPLATRIMGAIGAQCPAFDINAACSGFIYALRIAQAMNEGPVLIVCAEQTSRYVDYDDRRICILFGDGAGAAVTMPGGNLLHVEIHAIHDANQSLTAPGISNRGADGGSLPSYLAMDGQGVYKFASREMLRILNNTFDATGLTPEEFAAIIPHQANLRIIQSCAERIGLPMERFLINIDRCGNTSSASIPIALDEARRAGRLKAGDKVLLAGFGAGWTSGAAALTL